VTGLARSDPSALIHAAYLRGETDAAALSLSPSLGSLLESFILQELRKLAAYSKVFASTGFGLLFGLVRFHFAFII